MAGYWDKIGNIKGGDGIGVPAGGQNGQALHKVGDSDFATAWANVDYKDIEGKVPKSALPDIGNSTVPVNSEAAMLNLPAVVGNQAIRTDIGATFVLAEEPASELSNWIELVTTSDVQSVNGQTGNVNLTKGDVGLGNVSNTADADKPVATQSVNGLMSKADKEKLDGARDSTGPNSLVYRNSSGNAGFDRVYLSGAPISNNEATSKSYVDDLVGTVAGGSTVATTDWDAMRTAASTGVVEGFVKGCPVGGTVTDGMSAGFVKDPVWKLEVRPEGLGYVTQRAQLLSCVPVYMVGFAWERVYNPATSEWGGWTCVAGDTGPIQSVGKLSTSAGPEEALFHKSTTSAKLYRPDTPLWIWRQAGNVQFSGAMSASHDSIATTEGLSIAWLAPHDATPAGVPGVDWTLSWRFTNFSANGLFQGSGTNYWYGSVSGNDFYAKRYSGNVVDNRYLPFSVTYNAIPINTYTGPGFVPPEISADDF